MEEPKVKIFDLGYHSFDPYKDYQKLTQRLSIVIFYGTEYSLPGDALADDSTECETNDDIGSEDYQLTVNNEPLIDQECGLYTELRKLSQLNLNSSHRENHQRKLLNGIDEILIHFKQSENKEEAFERTVNQILQIYNDNF